MTFYETRTRQLLQNPGAPTTLYTTADLDGWINTARGQLAGEAECIRVIGTVQTVIGQRNYNFSSIGFSNVGLQGTIHVRRLMYNVGTGQKFVTPHPWEWFDLYYMNNPVPINGVPKSWAQYAQGSSGQGSITGIGTGSMFSGSFYLDPPPDLVYTLNCDCVCYPAALTADSDPEAIPYLFTDAVPFFAAYYALLSAQMNARMADAERMYNYYQTFLARARQSANPSVNRPIYQQADDPSKIAKLGLQKAANQ